MCQVFENPKANVMVGTEAELSGADNIARVCRRRSLRVDLAESISHQYVEPIAQHFPVPNHNAR